MPTPRKYSGDAERYAAYRQRKKEARLKEMADKGLPALPVIPSIPGTKRWTAIREQVKLLLRTLHDEMSDYRLDRSQSWQESERGKELEEQIEVIEGLLEALESCT